MAAKKKSEGQPPQAFSESSLVAFFSEANGVIEAAAGHDREQNRLHAHRFNLLAWIAPDENRLSDILADLLDPCGLHGQGDRFLRLLLKRLGESGSIARTTVQREAPTHGIAKYRRRIDILIESASIVAVENKLDSLEQQDQVRDYLDHLCFLCQDSRKSATMIYLTPNGRSPTSLSPHELKHVKESRRLRCWSYSGELQEWLRDCQAECEAEKIRFFLADFLAYIDAALNRETGIEEVEETP